MKTKISFCLLGLYLLSSSAAFALDQYQNQDQNQHQYHQHQNQYQYQNHPRHHTYSYHHQNQGMGNDRQGMAKDREAIAWLIALNKNEIGAADETLRRPVNNRVRDYASWLRSQHTQNLNTTMAISHRTGEAPLKTNSAIVLREKGKKELSMLREIDNNKQFQKAYIKAMVKGHEEALNKIENYLESVKNPQLRKHIQITRNHVAHHLHVAKQIQNTL